MVAKRHFIFRWYPLPYWRFVFSCLTGYRKKQKAQLNSIQKRPIDFVENKVDIRIEIRAMSTLELKSKIISQVQQMDDEALLNEIYSLIHAETDLSKIYVLSDNERSMVEEGLTDVRDGKIVSSEKATERLKEWLKK